MTQHTAPALRYAVLRPAWYVCAVAESGGCTASTATSSLRRTDEQQRHLLVRQEVPVPRPLRRESSEADSLKRTASPKRVCKDCYPEGHGLRSSMVGAAKPRPAPHPGPRCTTHHRARKKALSEASWARGIKERYGITPVQYWALYDAQGGCCYICTSATGASRRLSVDHDHATGYVRGLLCRPCNTTVGRLRDDPDAFKRGYEYLRNPPALSVIGKVKPGEG